jgi:sugar phosphate isomerase/epimerase
VSGEHTSSAASTSTTAITNPLARLSLNQATTRPWSVAEAVAGCRRAGIRHIGLWREHVAAVGVDTAARLVREAGLGVSSLCRGGFFAAADAEERSRRAADNRRAVDEAATLGTDTLVLVCGGLPPGSRDLDDARRQTADGIADLVPYAEARGVRLGIEPMHPMFCADRGVISTLAQALDLAEELPAATVGVVVDTYHVWWDPGVYEAIARAGGRIVSFQVSDWVTPLPAGALTGRALMGDGCVELRRLREAVDASGYTGPVEVEIFNESIWQTPGNELLPQLAERYLTYVA